MTFSKALKTISFFSLAFAGIQSGYAQKIKLFNGKNLDGWELAVQNPDANKNPKKYVQISDGIIHMYKDTDEDEKVPFGYMVTKDSTFSNFYFEVEYKWGNKKFEPRKNALKDAGILFHINNERKVWPSSVEYQIQEGDTGDLIFLESGGLTYRPNKSHLAPEGQGSPYLLPEDGGISDGVRNGYYGRMPVLDSLSSWNKCEIVVHGEDYAEYLVNGKVIARTGNFTHSDGSPLRSGAIALQYEGAEIQYRNVFVEKLESPLKLSKDWLSFSKVKDVLGQSRTVIITNPSTKRLALDVQFVGKHKNAFRIVNRLPDSISPHSSQHLEIEFSPVSIDERQSAGLKIGGLKYGAFVSLQGVLLKKFEGGNEVSLHAIAETLGIPTDVGGTQLHLSTAKEIVGKSIDITHFVPIPGTTVRVTPLARFSPKGSPPFGIIVNDKLTALGALQDVSDNCPDAHQCLFPYASGFISSVEFKANSPFNFYYEGLKYISSTKKHFDAKAPIDFTARVYPVPTFMGKKMKNTYLIGFEEASNGDYQDAVFLIENVLVK